MHAGIPPPGNRHLPLGADTPLGAETPPPPGADTTPPGSRHHPPGKQTPAYGLRVAGMHPTGMHSCL